MKVIIVGGGIMGSSVAYYLAKRGVASTIVERNGIACAASGKAGGFLAKNWCDGGEVGPLVQKSFDLHMQLAEELPDCGYRRLDTFSVSARQDANRPAKVAEKLPDWVDGPVTNTSLIGQAGDNNSTAQVFPEKLTRAFVEKAKELCGTDVVIGIVSAIEFDSNKKVTGVKVGDLVLPADIVVLTMGPWTGSAADWGVRVPRISGRRAHSIIMQPAAESAPQIGAQALFVDYRPRGGGELSCEVYPRPNGEVFVCGMSDREALPDKPEDVAVQQTTVNKLETVARAVSSQLTSATLVKGQACYLPTSPDGLPVIGRVPACEGVYVASGHSCWGILNAPATGCALAELIVTGRCDTVDLSPFDPRRFR